MRHEAKSFAKARKAALVALATAFVAQGAAQAAPRGGVYSAALETPLATPQQEIFGGILWKCAGTQCAAPAGGSRAVLACERLAKTFGRVARFASLAGNLSDEDLLRCNRQN